jgi:hypothetical protein
VYSQLFTISGGRFVYPQIETVLPLKADPIGKVPSISIEAHICNNENFELYIVVDSLLMDPTVYQEIINEVGNNNFNEYKDVSEEPW